jgi:hypothetical protein
MSSVSAMVIPGLHRRTDNRRVARRALQCVDRYRTREPALWSCTGTRAVVHCKPSHQPKRRAIESSFEEDSVVWLARMSARGRHGPWNRSSCQGTSSLRRSEKSFAHDRVQRRRAIEVLRSALSAVCPGLDAVHPVQRIPRPSERTISGDQTTYRPTSDDTHHEHDLHKKRYHAHPQHNRSGDLPVCRSPSPLGDGEGTRRRARFVGVTHRDRFQANEAGIRRSLHPSTIPHRAAGADRLGRQRDHRECAVRPAVGASRHRRAVAKEQLRHGVRQRERAHRALWWKHRG